MDEWVIRWLELDWFILIGLNRSKSNQFV